MNTLKKKESTSKLPLVACIVLLNKTGKVLCVTRRNEHIYGLPGGKVDSGEGVIEGAIRELYEETNLVVKPESLHKIYAFHEVSDKPPHVDYWTTTFFVHYEDVEDLSDLCQMEDGIVPAWLSWRELFNQGAFVEYNKEAKRHLQEYLLSNKHNV